MIMSRLVARRLQSVISAITSFKRSNGLIIRLQMSVKSSKNRPDRKKFKSNRSDFKNLKGSESKKKIKERKHSKREMIENAQNKLNNKESLAIRRQ